MARQEQDVSQLIDTLQARYDSVIKKIETFEKSHGPNIDVEFAELSASIVELSNVTMELQNAIATDVTRKAHDAKKRRLTRELGY